jgi:hypothetical protein
VIKEVEKQKNGYAHGKESSMCEVRLKEKV